ncbi:MAG TPA: polyribonucleotide nucleotidyltransferase [Candidatus Cloacimonadota bacterium]|nr:polyribonucleotide nucleotidyltransferase [Candidatus Cloacimonadota bacterium]
MHNFNITRKTLEFCGREMLIETGKMAKQANGAVFIQYGETAVLVTAVMAKEVTEGTDFFPLTVDYNERMYASGKIPGGFFKRESKPTTEATLNARLVDRAIRPLFPEGFRNAIHVVVNILSFDGVNDPNLISIFGASLALSISDIPFNGPIAGVTVGYINDQIVINPTLQELKDESKLNLAVAGSASSVVMIEAAANELSEQVMLDAVYAGHEEIKKLVAVQQEFVAQCGKPKIEIQLDLIPPEITAKVEADYSARIAEAAMIFGKQERQDAFDQAEEEMLAKYKEAEGDAFAETERYYKAAFDELIKRFVRDSILHKQHRVDGRGLDDLRDITCEIDVLPVVHGSALFTRGETQSLGTVTLGGADDEQVIDGLEEEYKKKFYLHYNFPPFSVGEVGRMGAPGRRELGHGNLAERALKAVIPSSEEFPYTIRVVSDILESNGSSSMASICSGTLALMAAGVPIIAPVAGIANGLIMEGDEYVVLTDIMGLEDHLGDMDFKCAGTRAGITAMQMDIKIEGITKEIMSIALEKAKTARLQILDLIEATIPAPREELSPTAPRIESFKIPVDKIGEVIGPSGKNIKAVIEACKVEINIEDDGTVRILSPDKAAIDKAKAMILGVVVEPGVGEVYEGVVTRMEPFGVFVKFLNGAKEGMVHVSELSSHRINQPSDFLSIGDKVVVRVKPSEKSGKISLTMKGLPGNPEPSDEAIAAGKNPANRPAHPQDRSNPGRGRSGFDHHGGDRDRDHNRRH